MARKNMTKGIEYDLQEEVKKFVVDLEYSAYNLIEEALRELLKKYKTKAK